MQGTVKLFVFEKGFGFITPDDGSAELFVHHTQIITGGFPALDEGQRVEFERVQGPKGPEARAVRPLYSR